MLDMSLTIQLLPLGLTLELFLDQDNYMLKRLSKNAGARVVIHDPNSAALPDQTGVNLQPNTATSIAIQKVCVEHDPV